MCTQLDARLRIQRERSWLALERQSNEATTGKLLRLGGPRQRAKIHGVVPETATPLDTENSGGLGAITAHGASWWSTAKVYKGSSMGQHDRKGTMDGRNPGSPCTGRGPATSRQSGFPTPLTRSAYHHRGSRWMSPHTPRPLCQICQAIAPMPALHESFL